ncbi:MAG: hypothetical protein WD847_18000 [Pirellulales bacterium]
MPTSNTPAWSQARAVICRIDLVNRELELLIGEARLNIGVPPDCMVVLRGEPVKLRMLQPGDRVRVTFRSRAGTAAARTIEVEGAPAAGA